MGLKINLILKISHLFSTKNINKQKQLESEARCPPLHPPDTQTHTETFELLYIIPKTRDKLKIKIHCHLLLDLRDVTWCGKKCVVLGRLNISSTDKVLRRCTPEKNNGLSEYVNKPPRIGCHTKISLFHYNPLWNHIVFGTTSVRGTLFLIQIFYDNSRSARQHENKRTWFSCGSKAVWNRLEENLRFRVTYLQESTTWYGALATPENMKKSQRQRLMAFKN